MTQEYAHKKGRRNINDQTSMQEKIIECYEKNISAAGASRETGYNIKTIYKHYGDLSKQVLELQTADFIERKNIETAQLISSYERLILKMQQLLDSALDEMSRLIQENKQISKHFIGDLTSITNYIVEMNEKKYNLSLKIVTIDKRVTEKDESEDMIKKIIRHLTIERETTMAYTEREIIQGIIYLTKCDVVHAKSIFSKMIDLGLDVCSRDDEDSEFSKKYWIMPFGLARDYVSNEEWNKIREANRKNELEN